MANTSDIRNGLCIRYNHDIFKIIDESPKFLKVEGRLFIEHGYNQGVKVKKYLQKKIIKRLVFNQLWLNMVRLNQIAL